MNWGTLGLASVRALLWPESRRTCCAFKSLSAIQINRILGRRGEAVWRRNYYEHIIRSLDEFQRIRSYILENPSRWHEDPENI